MKNQFNTESNSNLGKRVDQYDLSKNEKSNIWQIKQDLASNMATEKSEFRNQYKDQFVEEYNKIKANQAANPQLNMGKANIQEHTIRRMAHESVQSQFWGRLSDIEKQADKEIQNIFDKAKSEGRMIEPQRNQSYQPENNNDNR